MTVRMIGVSKSIRMADVQAMGGGAAQDQFIREVAQALEKDLREFVADTRPRSELVFQVTGPHNDPLQGLIYVHTLAGHFDTDDLPSTCGAYAAYVAPQN